MALFERYTSVTIDEAMSLLETYGRLTPAAFDHAVTAWDIYWHLRDMPGD